MKKLTLFIFTNCLLLLMAGTLQAQSASPSLDTLAIKEAKMLKQQLTLSESQETTIQQETKTYLAALDSLRQLSGDVELRKSAVHKVRKEYLGKLKEILTDTQYRQYKDLITQKQAAYKVHADQKKRPVSDIID